MLNILQTKKGINRTPSSTRWAKQPSWPPGRLGRPRPRPLTPPGGHRNPNPLPHDPHSPFPPARSGSGAPQRTSPRSPCPRARRRGPTPPHRRRAAPPVAAPSPDRPRPPPAGAAPPIRRPPRRAPSTPTPPRTAVAERHSPELLRRRNAVPVHLLAGPPQPPPSLLPVPYAPR